MGVVEGFSEDHIGFTVATRRMKNQVELNFVEFMTTVQPSVDSCRLPLCVCVCVCRRS